MALFNPFRIFTDLKRLRAEASLPQNAPQPCPVCGEQALYLDTVDFNKSCEEYKGLVFPASGIPVHYNLCDQCGFCFAPEFRSWAFEDFERLIYNSDYELVDPEYKSIRPLNCANFVEELFGADKDKIRHLDYGGGSGLLSETLRTGGWDSASYDPFVNRDINPEELGVFDLITAVEVFEHVPDIDYLFNTLKKLCKPEGLILFSTMLSDGNISRSQKLNWWYAAPRNGHVSIYSQKSLNLMASQHGLQFASYSPQWHTMHQQLPGWAHPQRNSK